MQWITPRCTTPGVVQLPHRAAIITPPRLLTPAHACSMPAEWGIEGIEGIEGEWDEWEKWGKLGKLGKLGCLLRLEKKLVTLYITA
jgi:hypothetical protein